MDPHTYYNLVYQLKEVMFAYTGILVIWMKFTFNCCVRCLTLSTARYHPASLSSLSLFLFSSTLPSSSPARRPDQGQSTGAESTTSSLSLPGRENEGGSLSCSSTPQSLPSFIALPSSPEDAIPPDTPPHALVPPTGESCDLVCR